MRLEKNLGTLKPTVKNNREGDYPSMWNNCGEKLQTASGTSLRETMWSTNVTDRELEQPEPDGTHIRTPCVLDTRHGREDFMSALVDFSLALIPALSLSLFLLCKIEIFTPRHLLLMYISSCLFLFLKGFTCVSLKSLRRF